MMRKKLKMTETLANGYSSECTQRELSNEYQHDRVKIVCKSLCGHVLWTNVASKLEELIIQVMKLDKIVIISSLQFYIAKKF